MIGKYQQKSNNSQQIYLNIEYTRFQQTGNNNHASTIRLYEFSIYSLLMGNVIKLFQQRVHLQEHICDATSAET